MTTENTLGNYAPGRQAEHPPSGAMTYIIYELQNLQSVRKGEIYSGTLRGAKAKATRDQVWQGTVLKITDEHGHTVAIKDQRTGDWYDPEA